MFKHYRFIDWVTQGYVLLVALFILAFNGSTVPHWHWLVLAHVMVLVVVHLLISAHTRHTGNKVLDFFRHFYPVLLYTGFYRETGLLNHVLNQQYLDVPFLRLEQRLFGFQPGVEMMNRFPYVWVSEIFYASYFSYYIMISGVGLTLFLRNRKQFFHYVSIVSFVFYCCYLTYIALPVMGPRILYREFPDVRLPPDIEQMAVPQVPAAVTHGPFYHIMHWIYHTFESPGAAFPSSHVAIALTTVFFSFLYLRRIRYVHLGVAMLLCASTVYCRYHYAVDVIGGALTAAVLVPLGNWLYWRFEKRSAAPAVETANTANADLDGQGN